MLRLFKWMHNKKGFTLIELMIVVAIIGILAAIAIPNFLRFQAKSKQAEAKTNLGAIGTTAEAYRAEKDTYVTSFTGLGWSPQGSSRYSYFYNGSTGANLIIKTMTSATDTSGTVPANVAATQTAFTAGASGNIDTDTTVDQWTYTDQRVLTNTVDDVAS